MPSEQHYNDNAFDYFILFIIAVIAIPFTFIFVKRKFFGNSKSSLVHCPCEPCKQKEKQLGSAKNNLPSLWTIVQFILLVILWVAFFYTVSNIMTRTVETTSAPFDPYAVLGLEPGASTDEIKKAYRKLSLIHHPDKAPDPNDPEVQTKYIRIVKAYDSLTDELARANWEKYGNPDGPQAFSVGIALPSWLVKEDNTMIVLGVYIALLVVGVPTAVGCWWSNSRKYDTTKVMNSTMGLYAHEVQNLSRVKVIAELISASEEFKHITVRNSDQVPLQRVMHSVPEKHEMKKKPRYPAPFVVKTHILLYSQLSRLQDKLTPQLLLDLKEILLKCPPLLMGVITIATAKGNFLVPILESLQLLQMLTQSAWSDTPLLQLPHVTEDIVSTLASKKFKITDLPSFIRLGKERRGNILSGEGLDAGKIQDVERVLQFLPTNVNISCRCEVEGEDINAIVCNAVVTMFYTIERVCEGDIVNAKEERAEDNDGADKKDTKESRPKKSREDDRHRVVHAPYFPEVREECWWVIVGDPKDYRLLGINKVGNFGKKTEGKVKFVAPDQPGLYNYTVYLMCDGYVGCDKQRLLRIQVTRDTAMEEQMKLEREKAMKVRNAKSSKTKKEGEEDIEDDEDEDSFFDSDTYDTSDRADSDEDSDETGSDESDDDK